MGRVLADRIGGRPEFFYDEHHLIEVDAAALGDGRIIGGVLDDLA